MATINERYISYRQSNINRLDNTKHGIHTDSLNILKNLFSRKNNAKFVCNICGTSNSTGIDKLDREIASCSGCRSTVRMRAMVHILVRELTGNDVALPDLPPDGQQKGIGMSDWNGYAEPLSKVFDYTNTFYHKEPKLDITDIPSTWENTMDFIVSSDVYEHVPPPVSLAFENTKRLLKSDGVFVFSVPFKKEGTTEEHFPELHDFKLERDGSQHVLHNVTKDGKTEEFRDLIFHGGEGSTLEIRVFSETDLINNLRSAGFSNIKIWSEDYLPFGIHWQNLWSLPISARLTG